jgi:hypothetical protein
MLCFWSKRNSLRVAAPIVRIEKRHAFLSAVLAVAVRL